VPRRPRVCTVFFYVLESLSDARARKVSLVAGGGQEVMVQGKQTQVVLELLSSLGVPKKWIEVADMADKKK
jgi:translation initiation factor 2D